MIVDEIKHKDGRIWYIILPTITSSYPNYVALSIVSIASSTSIPVFMFRSVLPNYYPAPRTAFLLMLVFTNSGYILVTPMLNCLISALRDLKNPAVPNLAAEYIVLKPVPINPAIEMIFTNLPLLYLINSGKKPLVIAICDMQFVFSII